jgi:hypothetical protein
LSHSLRRLVPATVLLLAAVFVVACSGDDDVAVATDEGTTEQSQTEQITAEATTEGTTTEEGPPPITASEQRWLQEVNQLRAEFTRSFRRTKVYTNTAMTRLAEAYSTCLRSLRQAGDPGRFGPAARIAERACKKVESAGRLMEKAVAIEDAGIYSQAQADKYSALVSRALEAQGNAINAFERAKARAASIRLELNG